MRSFCTYCRDNMPTCGHLRGHFRSIRVHFVFLLLRTAVLMALAAEISHAHLSHDCKDGIDAFILHLFSKETAHMRPFKTSF